MDKWILPAAGILVVVTLLWWPFLLLVGSVLALYFVALAHFNHRRPLPYLSLAPAGDPTGGDQDAPRVIVNWFAKPGERTACRLYAPSSEPDGQEEAYPESLHIDPTPVQNIYTGKWVIHSVELPSMPSGTTFEYDIVRVPQELDHLTSDSNSPQLHPLFGKRPFRVMTPSPEFESAGLKKCTLRVVALGDLQPKAIVPPLLQWWILRQVRRSRPDLLLFLGDHTNEGTDPKGWVQFYHLLGPIACQTPVLGVPGNHDTELKRKTGPRAITEAYETFVNYPAPKQRYFLRVHGLQILAFDFTSGFGPGSPNMELLERVLPRLRADQWVVVLWHSSPHNTLRPGEAALTLRETVVPRLDAKGCRLWLAGHEHAYQRFRVGDTQFVTTAATSSFHHHRGNDEFLERLVMKFHFLQLEVTPDAIQCRAISLRGKNLDEFQISRS